MTHDDETVERVARAIWDVDAPDHRMEWDDETSAGKERYLCIARAALSALPRAEAATHCFECNTELHGPYCPKCADDALEALSFQSRVQPWMMACFGAEIAADKLERADRFIEEALELCQTAPGFSIDRAHALVDYVFNRPQGDINQEVGGVMVTLAAFCLAFDLDMHGAGETELARVWTKVEQIRAKQAAKPKGSALPIAQEPRS